MAEEEQLLTENDFFTSIEDRLINVLVDAELLVNGINITEQDADELILEIDELKIEVGRAELRNAIRGAALKHKLDDVIQLILSASIDERPMYAIRIVERVQLHLDRSILRYLSSILCN